MDTKDINKRFFLKYSDLNSKSLDKNVRQAIALYIYANYKEDVLIDAEIDYEIELSMREWNIRRLKEKERQASKWAIKEKRTNLILDSALRDQHIVKLKSKHLGVERIKVSFDRLIEKSEGLSLYSISEFKEFELLCEYSKEARSQVRWLTIPNSECEGILFSPKGGSISFIPLLDSNRSSRKFKLKKMYSINDIFEYASDLRLP